MRLKITFASLVGVGLLLYADSLSAATPTDACALLTPARVSAVLGVSVGGGEHIPPARGELCGWAQPSDTSHSGKRVVLDVFGPIGGLTPAERFAIGKKPVNGITKTPVTSLGDDAYYITTPGLGTGLNVKKGAAVFQIRVYGFPVDQIQALEKSLAQDVLTKF
jgi:hypothetical protein